jgi:hypothetical protein
MAMTTDKAKKELAKDGGGGGLANVQYSMPSSGGGGNRGYVGGGGATNQRMPSLNMPASVASSGSRFSPAVITQPQSALGNLVGARTPTAYGASGRFRFKEGGKVKKMAKGGSTASKRADGCATKGKTKGRFV